MTNFKNFRKKLNNLLYGTSNTESTALGILDEVEQDEDLAPALVEIPVVTDHMYPPHEINEIISFKVDEKLKCFLKLQVSEYDLESDEMKSRIVWVPFDNVEDRPRIVSWLTRSGLERTVPNISEMGDDFEKLVTSETQENISGKCY